MYPLPAKPILNWILAIEYFRLSERSVDPDVSVHGEANPVNTYIPTYRGRFVESLHSNSSLFKFRTLNFQQHQ